MNCFEDDTAVNIPFKNHEFRDKPWVVTDPIVHENGPSSDVQRQLSCLDYFLIMFPPKQLRNMVQLTNLRLVVKKNRTTTTGEMLKKFGIMILITQY